MRVSLGTGSQPGHYGGVSSGAAKSPCPTAAVRRRGSLGHQRCGVSAQRRCEVKRVQRPQWHVPR
jgi:hypothetical protein